MNRHSRAKAAGFVSIELIFALIVISVMASLGIDMAAKWSESQNYRIAAGQQQAVADAASKYLKDNYTAIAAAATAAPVQITVSMLRNTGYLSAGFADTNAFGQTLLAVSRKSGTNQLESLVITTGGEVIDEIGTREIAENLGASGGFVPVANAGIVQGIRGGWQVSLNNFGLNPGVGHTASALFLQDGTLANDYLYRNSIAGKPELNRMNTGLNMGSNNIANAQNITASDQIEGGTVQSMGRTEVGEYLDIASQEIKGSPCEKTGLVSKTAQGLILSCQEDSSGNLVWSSGSDFGYSTYSNNTTSDSTKSWSLGAHKICAMSGVTSAGDNGACSLGVSQGIWTVNVRARGDGSTQTCRSICID